ncbi:hypothetical protein [Ktedonobacter racemifer]|uniref:Uncharacterized protein n=1 Tax=Ktedonobacter racemifer DSM 44963 TaxID=485913 RepID=D6U8T4_KTERA|nr:hypothetical protein [Ktedonobacter racemifer]EFH79644.1 hypothetical protein Krac_0122 [Ktedonobacter racemifer DSM 44963]
MPKDSKKYRYLTAGIEWDSWTLKQLEQDAELHQMSDQMAKLMVLRLTEYYKLVERGVIMPGATAMMQQQYPPIQAAVPAPLPLMGANGNGAMMQSSQPMNGRRESANTVPLAQAEPEPQIETIGESENADANAEEALNFWDMDED